jgi:wyosine [tRNA(Phe)-imidazoG37] synthetase (radical SAM superfamily)
VDALPFKTCDLDCLYCQLGRTTVKTLKRKAYVSAEEILKELASVLKDARGLDFISFSGSGEPTLNTELGAMIRGAKKLSKVPVAVITNGTLLWHPDVAGDLMAADAVLPSLDAASPEAFKKLDRPVPGLSVETIIDGLVEFRKRYKGKLWLEVMLIKGVNDSASELRRLSACVKRIRPDRVDINIPVRPSDERVLPPSPAVLSRAKALFGPKAVIIISKTKAPRPEARATEARVEEMVMRRPVTAADISASLGLHPNEAAKLLGALLQKSRIRAVRRSGRVFFRRS